MLNRRHFLALSVAGVAFASRANAGERRATLERALAEIEASSGGRLGVAVLDTADGSIVGRRADERFPLCSTSKALVAGAILRKVDDGGLHLGDRIAVTASDILSYAPVAKTHVGGDLSVAELCTAAITVSDNTAANLLVAALGGPAAVTAFARKLDDTTTRLDRTEPDLNEAAPGDPRDTTTPAAIAKLIARLATGDALSRGSREKWVDWLIGCKTGAAKLRAGLPPDWRVGDKTGSGGHGASNDVAIAWPPSRPPFVIAAYLAETTASDAVKNATHAAVARAAVAASAG